MEKIFTNPGGKSIFLVDFYGSIPYCEFGLILSHILAVNPYVSLGKKGRLKMERKTLTDGQFCKLLIEAAVAGKTDREFPLELIAAGYVSTREPGEDFDALKYWQSRVVSYIQSCKEKVKLWEKLDKVKFAQNIAQEKQKIELMKLKSTKAGTRGRKGESAMEKAIRLASEQIDANAIAEQEIHRLELAKNSTDSVASADSSVAG